MWSITGVASVLPKRNQQRIDDRIETEFNPKTVNSLELIPEVGISEHGNNFVLKNYLFSIENTRCMAGYATSNSFAFEKSDVKDDREIRTIENEKSEYRSDLNFHSDNLNLVKDKNILDNEKAKDKTRKLVVKTTINKAVVKSAKDIGEFSWELIGEKVTNPLYVVEIKRLDKNGKPIQAFTEKTDNTKISAKSVFKTDKIVPGNYQWQVIETTSGICSSIMYFSSEPCQINFSIDSTNIDCLGYMGTNIRYKICFNSTYQSSTGDLTYISSGSGFSVWDQGSSPILPVSAPLLVVQPGSPMNTVHYCFEVVVPASVSQIGFGLQGDDLNLTPIECKPGVSNTIDSLPSCKCTDCDSIQIIIPGNDIGILNSILWLKTPVIVMPGAVKTIKTQLVNFEFYPESTECMPCNRDSRQWGNFINGTLNDIDFNTNGILNWGHELQWNSNHLFPSNLNGIFKFNISLPPLVKCCDAKIRFCIRYIFEFDNCVVCEKVICYSYSLTNK
jgi:hypothetical protein